MRHGQTELNRKGKIHGNNNSAISHAKRALKHLLAGTPDWFRARDIVSIAKKD